MLQKKEISAGARSWIVQLHVISKHYGVGQFDSMISVLFFKGAELRKSNQTLDTRGIDKQR